jgi:hypothetical protein
MIRDEILAAFDRIRVWQQGDRRAVHKPLLVLLALGRLLRGESPLVEFAGIEDKLGKLLEEFGPSGSEKTRHNPPTFTFLASSHRRRLATCRAGRNHLPPCRRHADDHRVAARSRRRRIRRTGPPRPRARSCARRGGCPPHPECPFSGEHSPGRAAFASKLAPTVAAMHSRASSLPQVLRLRARPAHGRPRWRPRTSC